MKHFLVSILFAFSLASCPPVPTPAPGVATCAAVCANMTALNCPSAKPTAKGATCEQVCTNFQNSGITKLNLGCRASAVSCAAADACELGK
jgi:hypothetical protein